MNEKVEDASVGHYQNTACIVEDGEGKRELQITIRTYLTDPKRMSVLMSMAMDQVTQIEREVATAEAKVIEDWHENYQATHSELVETPVEEPSPILGPDFAPASPQILLTDN